MKRNVKTKKATIPDRLTALNWLYDLGKQEPYDATKTKWCNDMNIGTYFGDAALKLGVIKSFRQKNAEGKRRTYIQWISPESPSVEMAQRLYEYEVYLTDNAKSRKKKDEQIPFPEKEDDERIGKMEQEIRLLTDEIDVLKNQMIDIRFELAECVKFGQGSIRIPITFEKP